MSHLLFLTKKVGRNQNQGETSQGEMSQGEMSVREKCLLASRTTSRKICTYRTYHLPNLKKHKFNFHSFEFMYFTKQAKSKELTVGKMIGLSSNNRKMKLLKFANEVQRLFAFNMGMFFRIQSTIFLFIFTPWFFWSTSGLEFQAKSSDPNTKTFFLDPII